MTGLWRNNKETPEGKYLVKRRDGTIPEWPSIVLGARDPNAPAALIAYAAEAIKNDMDLDFVQDIIHLAMDFKEYRKEHGTGDPDSGPNVTDDPDIIKEMSKGKSA